MTDDTKATISKVAHHLTNNAAVDLASARKAEFDQDKVAYYESAYATLAAANYVIRTERRETAESPISSSSPFIRQVRAALPGCPADASLEDVITHLRQLVRRLSDAQDQSATRFADLLETCSEVRDLKAELATARSNAEAAQTRAGDYELLRSDAEDREQALKQELKSIREAAGWGVPRGAPSDIDTLAKYVGWLAKS